MESADTLMTKRIAAVDVARFYAMILVYYGHIVEQVMYLGSHQAAMQYKFIYSFHMPLFFLIAGTVVAEKKLQTSISSFIRVTLAARLAPYVLFSALLAGGSLLFSGWFPVVPLVDVSAYIEATASTLVGFPAFCVPLWFMSLLLSVELFHYFLSSRIKRSSFLIAVAAVLYIGGYYLNESIFFVGRDLTFWFVHEVPVVYCFYLTGYLIRRHGWLEFDISRAVTGTAGVLLLIAVAATFDLNQGPFRIIEAVIVVLSGHGHVVLFVFTALSGSIMILCAASAGPGWQWLRYMGKNSLSLFCLNGIFYHFINPSAAQYFAERFDMTHVTVFIYSVFMTAISLLLCVPAVYLLTRFLPQLMGKPTRRGPLLRPLIRS